MAANLTTADSILKEFYIAPIIEQINQEAFMLQTFETESVDWQGKKAIVPVHTARNSGVGFRTEGQPLPTAGNQGYDRLEVPAKFAYGRFGFTGPSLEFSDTERGSFEPVMTGEMKRLVEDCRALLDKACFTGGEMIGLVWQQQNSVTWQYSGRPDATVDTSWGVAVGAGHTVDFINLSDFTVLAGGPFQVNAITETLMTLNAAADTTPSVNGTVFAIRHNDAARAAELEGILSNLFDPSYYGITRTLAAGKDILFGNSLVADFNAAAPVYFDLSLDSLQIMLDKILLKSNASVDLMVLNPVHRQSYTTLLQGTASGIPGALRSDVKSGAGKGDAGYTAIGYADIPFRTAQHCPKGSIHFIAKKFWGTFQRRPGDFAQADGKVLNKVPNFDSYEGYWKYYANLVATRPNASGTLTGVNFFGV